VCFEQKKRKKNFTICLDVSKIRRKNCSNILEMGISKFENFKYLLPNRQSKEEYT